MTSRPQIKLSRSSLDAIASLVPLLRAVEGMSHNLDDDDSAIASDVIEDLNGSLEVAIKQMILPSRRQIARATKSVFGAMWLAAATHAPEVQ